MIKRIVTTCAKFASSNSSLLYPKSDKTLLFNKIYLGFSQGEKLTVDQIPHENKQIRAASITLGEQQVDYFKTQGGISILEKVPGVKAQSGQLYVLKFRCSVCQAQSIRSFTKHSYHKGVVMVRCGGCQKIHLVADNLGWFQDTAVNIETMHEGKVQKVYDPIAIVRFLQSALAVEKDQTPQSKEQTSSEKVTSK